MAISPDELLTTAALSLRPARARDYRREAAAMNAMLECMLRDPDRLQQCFVEHAVELCDAGSAGISMLEKTAPGDVVFRWTALAGAFAPYVGGSTPRNFSPCGLCLDQNRTILLSWPARVFTYFAEASETPITEGLIVPLYDADGAAVGTIWIVAHDETRQFCATDAAIVEEIAGFFTRACTIVGDVRQQREKILKLDTRLVREKEKRRKAEEQLRQTIKMEAMGQLTGGVAHDFNNVLAVVIGSLEMLREQPKRDAEQVRRIAERALAAAGRGARLTKQLLAFARRESLNPQPVDLRERVQAAFEMLGPTFGPQIEFRLTGKADLWPVLVDANALDMALVNLAVNARDAMSGAGTITVRTHNVRFENSVLNDQTLSGGYVALTICDTGKGMPPDVVDRACEPFFTTKEAGKGTGLGLSTVFGFVKQSGGAMKIDSELGVGTAVTLYLPRAAGRHAAAPKAAAAPERAQPELVGTA